MRTYPKLFTRTVARVVSALLVATTAHAFSEPGTYLYALEAQRAQEAKVREIAKKMNVDPEFLLHPAGRRSFDFKSLFDAVTRTLGLKSESVTDAPQSVKDQIAQVKQRYALVAADTTLAKIAELLDIKEAKNKGQVRAQLQSVLRLLDKDFLPPLPAGLPGVAASRDAQMRAQMNQFRQTVKSVINAPHALDDQNLDATLAQLRTVSTGSLRTRGNGNARWAKDPFPVKDAYKQAPKQSVGNRYGADSVTSTKDATTPAIVANAAPLPASLKPMTTAVSSEITALAQQLGTPAKAFAFVYDNVDWETYGGVVKGPLGALHERAGNDWDQALLLRDLLAAQGYQAQIEWGKVSLPIARAMNLAGTEDPLQAANLLATGGLDSVALTQNGSPLFIQFTHAWVRAYIPYVPNRGTTNGTPDTWVRMDPSFKKYDYQPGIDVNVSWNENNYLQTSAIRPPVDHYSDQVWSYIRANNLNCNNLAQVPKTGAIHKANFPFVPATLNAKIEQLKGLAANPPAAQMQTVTLSVSDPMWGDVLTTYSANLADLYGKKLTLTFQPATADDAATIARYGSLYNTPAYLVHLKAVFAVDDVPVAEGGSALAGSDLSLDLSFREPVLGTDSTHHEIVAGEAMTEVFDGGRASDALIAQRMERLKQMSATAPANDAQRDALITEKLQITGLRYMQEVDDTFTFSTGVRWHRWVKSVFEGCVRQTLQVSYNFIGTAVRVTPADHNIDVTRVTVGIIPITNDMSERLNAMALAGLNSSYLEGSIWEEMESQQGISATKALLLARMAGQRIWTADRTNVDSVLASINLSAEAENNIRGAVSQGRIAIVPTSPIRLNKWAGTGYILRDPIGGSAVYPIAGGFAGGSSTGGDTSAPKDTLGDEAWLNASEFSALLERIAVEAGLPPSSSGPTTAPSTSQSDPVNTSTGNMYRTWTDIMLAALGAPAAIDRTYNSRSSYNGHLGYGWTAWYDEHMVPAGNGAVLYRQFDGTEHLFTRNADGSYTPPAGVHLTLAAAVGGGYTTTNVDGYVRTFDANGWFVRVVDPNGNTFTVARDAAGNPLSMSDTNGRIVFTFTMTNGKITAVTDAGGRSIAYGYDGDDLVSCTDAAGKVWTYAYDLRHNMTQFVDPVGNTQSYDYDTDDRLMHHVDATGAEEFFHYDIAGRETVVTDKRGGDRLVRYDDSGRAVMEADPAGNMATSTWDASNNRTSVVDTRGYTTTYEYNAAGLQTKETLPDGSSGSTTWSANGKPLVITDAAGAVTTNTFDAAGNLLQSSRTAGGVTLTTTNTYDSHGLVLTTTDPNGNTVASTYNDNGVVLTRTNEANQTTTFTLDTLGRVLTTKDPAGNISTTAWDAKDRLTYLKDGYGRETTIAYDAAGRRTSITDVLGTSTMTWDGEGRPLSKKDQMGYVESVQYNGAGDVIAQTDRRGNVTHYEYDATGRLQKRIDANGGVWSYEWCAGLGSSSGAGGSCSSCGGSSRGGNSFCKLVDPNGNTIVQEFDTRGHVSKIADTLGHVQLIEYDAMGRRTTDTDANGHVTRLTYDEAGRLTKVTEPSGAVTSYTYDKNGNRLSVKDPNNHVWSFTYDPMNRITSETDPLNRTTSYTYDPLGNIATRTDPAGLVTRYTFNIARLTAINYPDGTSDTFTFDTAGRRISTANASGTFTYTYDLRNRTKTVTSSKVNATISYEYDGEGNPTKMTTVKGAVTYAYDGRNRLVTMTDPVFGIFRFGYDAAGRRAEVRFPNGTKTNYQYDNGNRMTAVATTSASGTLVDAWSYTYDAAGNRLSKTDVDGKSETYSFDQADRLTRANYADGTFESFGYDLAGNRTGVTTNSGTTTSYTYDAANQMLSAGSDTFTYDVRGNMLSRTSAASGNLTLTYDHRNRVKTVTAPSQTETNEYGAMGERTAVTSPAVEGSVRPMYDLSANPILDFDTGNGVWIYRAYGPGMDEPLAEWRRTNNQTTYLHRDGLGSVTAVTDATGTLLYRQTYTVFGKMARSAVPSGISPTRLGFTSRESSLGSLMNYRARYYDTATGRFTSQDDYRGDAKRPPSLHRYAYVNNDPVDYVDPTGHFPWVFLGWAIFMMGVALMIINAIIYALFEPCPQFANCLALVSGVVLPTVMALCALAILTGGLIGAMIGIALGIFLVLQNNCMADKWSRQDSPEWRASQATCATAGWSSLACCHSRVIGEQTGYTDCLSFSTLYIPYMDKVAGFVLPFSWRVNTAAAFFCHC